MSVIGWLHGKSIRSSQRPTEAAFSTHIALCCLKAVIHLKHLRFVMRGVCTSRKKQCPAPGTEELGMFQLSSIHQCHSILYYLHHWFISQQRRHNTFLWGKMTSLHLPQKHKMKGSEGYISFLISKFQGTFYMSTLFIARFQLL